jgi:hypothetical protein
VESQFTKVRVAGDGDALIGLCQEEQYVVSLPSEVFLGSQDVVTEFAQPADDWSWNVLVRQETHARPLSA